MVLTFTRECTYFIVLIHTYIYIKCVHGLPNVYKKDSYLLCLFVLLLYVQSQQLWSLRDGQFT